MRRLPATLVVIGVLMGLLAARQYREARNEYDYVESICGLSCSPSMSWWPTLAFAVLAVVALVGAWMVRRSVVTKRTEDLVG